MTRLLSSTHAARTPLTFADCNDETCTNCLSDIERGAANIDPAAANATARLLDASDLKAMAAAHASITCALTAAAAPGWALDTPLYQRVMAYQFEPLVERLEEKERWPRALAESVFSDMKRFMFLCGTKQAGNHISPPELIDVAWHHFILFTQTYMRTCDQWFGAYVHHRPYTLAQRQVMIDRNEARVTVQRTIDLAHAAFGPLSPNWYAVKFDAETGAVLHNSTDCEGSTNCGGDDPPCC